MTSRLQKVDRVFAFFMEKQRNNETFTLQELADAAGWTLSTVKAYRNKKWWGILGSVGGGQYRCTERILTFNQTTFRQHQSQKEHVAKYFFQLMVEKAVSACISAIEVYNKPDFAFREESFSVLMVNAWELLLKAKILQESDDDQTSIQIFSRDGSVVLGASGNPKTISVTKALNRLTSSGVLRQVVTDNVHLLVEIRDESVHFIHSDRSLNLRVQQIGTASLKNFMTLAQKWFGYDFTSYNFYLMPVSFFHATDMESFSVDSRARDNLLRYLTQIERKHDTEDDSGLHIALVLKTELVKAPTSDALAVRTTDDPSAPAVRITEEDALKGYQYDYDQLWKLLKQRYKNFMLNQRFHKIRKSFIDQGERFAKNRPLDPRKPNGTSKMFYHTRIVEEFDKHYDRK